MLANRLRTIRKRVSPLVYGVIDLVAGSANQPGNGSNRPDRRQFGYSVAIAIGSISSGDPFQGYTVAEIRESLEYNSSNGTYVGLNQRQVWFQIESGSQPLVVTDITSVTCPMGQVLLASAVSSFNQYTNDGQWGWVVTTGTHDYADYIQSGSFQVNP